MNAVIERTLPRRQSEKSVDDLIAELHQTEGKAEIINGKIVNFMATGDEPSSAAFNIAIALKIYQRKINRGRTYTDNVDYVVNLPNRK